MRVVNVGLEAFGRAIREQGAEAVDVEWRIPAGGQSVLVRALARLYGPMADRIERTNQEVLRRMDEAAPVLLSVGTARQEVPGMDDRTLLHPGPPLTWEELCDPLRRSARAAIMAEGWASSAEEADALAARGEIELEPANGHAAVLPMGSVIGPSAPVFVVENPQGANRAYSGINQGPGKTAWFGVDAPEAVENLVFLREAVGPVLDAALRAGGAVNVFSLTAQGLQMGDDAHMRTQASTNLFIRHLLPHLMAVEHPPRVDVAAFLSRNHLFFLNIAMAAAKAAADWAAEVPGSSIVTAMARNGTTFGIRLGALSGGWFVAPAPPVEDALYHGEFGPEDAALDIGDSAVLELVGLGGAAAAASPAVAAFVGGTMADAVASTEAMERICAGRSTRFQLPFLDFRGSPLGVDVRRVVESEITPRINTGILDAVEGRGQVGAGVARAPVECFRQAILVLSDALGGAAG